MANTIEIIGSWPSGETEYVIGTENPSRLPPVSDADNGDVLTVVNGAWKDAAPTGGGGGGGGGGGLPPVTADDNGDVLTVVDGAWGKAAPSGGLPPVTSADNGDFLGVNNGEWGKVGGYSVTETTETVIPEQTVTTVDDNGWIWAEISARFSSVSVGDAVTVTFNNVDYKATVFDWDGNKALGELDGEGNPSFDNYPFFIDEMDGGAELVTETAETVTISAIKTVKTATVSDDFALAIDAAIPIALIDMDALVTPQSGETTGTAIYFINGGDILHADPVYVYRGDFNKLSAALLCVVHDERFSDYGNQYCVAYNLFRPTILGGVESSADVPEDYLYVPADTPCIVFRYNNGNSTLLCSLVPEGTIFSVGTGATL